MVVIIKLFVYSLQPLIQFKCSINISMLTLNKHYTVSICWKGLLFLGGRWKQKFRILNNLRAKHLKPKYWKFETFLILQDAWLYLLDRSLASDDHISVRHGVMFKSRYLANLYNLKQTLNAQFQWEKSMTSTRIDPLY